MPVSSPVPRSALVVRGGWEGHAPVATTELFIPALRAAGFVVEVADGLDVYCDAELLAGTDLVVQCWSEGERREDLSEKQSAGLVAAVAAGTGFAGWHGGVLAAFRNPDYLRMVGGLFLFHPPEFLSYRVEIEDAHAGHPIVAGLGDFDVHSEQYWVITDARNTVLATTSVDARDGGQGGDAVPMPVVWTRRWGAGKVFVSAVGHRVEDLREPTVRTLTERGLLWAAR
ncbi:type 1 glutamine amidotransferase [Catenulispora sp. EB89]|uniref:ThuA domain-containing protein n=1 Tax=Catenulispora sp. EB89 TaxID=3156257 RepID=UPI003518EC98